MARLRRNQLVSAYDARQSIHLGDEREKSWAAGKLREVASNFSIGNEYDIFLSHSYDDARVIDQIYQMLRRRGYRVYVDWIEDGHLDRSGVDETTTALLRNRLDRSGSLIYVTSKAAEKSVWMPWELGYMDGRTGLVAVAPVLEADEDEEFPGREYLTLYPYLDLTGDMFFIHSDVSTYVGFDRWMRGAKPGM